jgi:hypothetical protein
MGLSDRTEASLGRMLEVTPVYGMGWWYNNEPAGKSRPIDVPGPFLVRLAQLFHSRGERRGGIARVETPGHELQHQWLIFSTRHEGSYDFDDHVAYYNLDFTPDEPTDSLDGWPRSAATSGFQGFGQIRLARSP